MAPGLCGRIRRDDRRVLRTLRGLPGRVRALAPPRFGKRPRANVVLASTIDIAAWIAQALGAFVFGLHRYTLLFRPDQALRQFPWAGDVPDNMKRLIGTAELLGAIGLIVPAVTRVLPWLTPLAALGLAAIMVLAALFHITRREWANVAFNLVLGAIAGFVAYARYAAVPLS